MSFRKVTKNQQHQNRLKINNTISSLTINNTTTTLHLVRFISRFRGHDQWTQYKPFTVDANIKRNCINSRKLKGLNDHHVLQYTNVVLRLVWEFDGIVQKHIHNRLTLTLKCSFSYPEHSHCQF